MPGWRRNSFDAFGEGDRAILPTAAATAGLGGARVPRIEGSKFVSCRVFYVLGKLFLFQRESNGSTY